MIYFTKKIIYIDEIERKKGNRLLFSLSVKKHVALR